MEMVWKGSPWLILDHYLTLRHWEPNFDPFNTKEEKVTVWVRFPGIPIEYHDGQFLTNLSRRIGTPVKCDSTTSHADRVNFARVCIEVDLTKTLVSKYRQRKRVLYIEFERLHLVCFQCGKYGHTKETCYEVTHKEQAVNTSMSEAEVLKGLGTSFGW
ncbi:Zinc ion binding nucleic acid binding protein [Quillaja saponaria]|uniref:Zinc ion binding nucleic acid binding protein n=1 Tax=Quillaja saponaria TaxID=32244 RepID=A0AAD7LQ20_QUISA|nr:Zinc ion binding nucleic acid binding protein [Quillaja saponaria]